MMAVWLGVCGIAGLAGDFIGTRVIMRASAAGDLGSLMIIAAQDRLDLSGNMEPRIVADGHGL
jgi:hypothetical protein